MTAQMWDDERLERALAGVADLLDVPPGPVAGAVRAPSRGRRSRRFLLAAAVVALLVAALVVAPGARRAVADWFGLGTVTIQRRADPDRVGVVGLVDGIDPRPVADGVAEVGLDPTRLDDPVLGRPARAGRPPEGGIVLVWSTGAVTLWSVGLDEATAFVKPIGPEVVVTQLPDLGRDAVLLDGPHDLITPIRAVIADRVIWWTDGVRQFRLEGDLPAADLVALATRLVG